MTQINFAQCQWLTGAAIMSQLPPDTGKEVAFVGRSNAGKSSAINAICQQRGLARASKTPGRTQQINLFSLPDLDHRLVDLPGFGFARVTEKTKRHWHILLDKYLRTRKCLQGLLLIMDIRHPLKPFDIQMLEWTASVNLPIHILLSKADKLKRGPTMAVCQKVERFLEDWNFDTPPTVQSFSAHNKMGLDTVRDTITEWINDSTAEPKLTQ